MPKDYFAKLNEKNIADLTKVSEKPASSSQKKFKILQRISLTEENDSLLENCNKVAKELSNFFVNNVKNFNENCDSFTENINDPILKAIVKWRNHPSILAIVSKYENKAKCSFDFISKEDIFAEMSSEFCDNIGRVRKHSSLLQMLEIWKGATDNDTPFSALLTGFLKALIA